MRIEFRYFFAAGQFANRADSDDPSWSNEYPVPSPHRLVPPLDIVVSDPSEVISDLVTNLSAWKSEFDPDVGIAEAPIGPCLVIDIQAYSLLSEAESDRPVERLQNLLIPMKMITSWT